MAERQGYTILQIGLHWAVAFFVFAAWFSHDGMGRALEQRITSGATGMEDNTAHVWFGGLAFLLVLIRIVVRLRTGAPAHLPGTSPMMAKAATWGHGLLYVLMVLTPFLGAMAWYGGIEAAGEIHEVMGDAMMIVVVGHVLAAVIHQAFGQNVFIRMIQPEE